MRTRPPLSFQPRLSSLAAASTLSLLVACSGQPTTDTAPPTTGNPPAGQAPVAPPPTTPEPGPCPGPTEPTPSGELVQSGAFDVLVFSKTNGCRHASIPEGVRTIQALGAANNFSVTASEDASLFTSAALEKYEVVVFLNTTGEILNEDQQQAFQRFIRANNGFMGIHAAETELNWPWFGALLGARQAGTPTTATGTLRISSDPHPSTAHLDRTWTIHEQWHSFRDVQGNIVPLLHLGEDGLTVEPKMGAYHPVSWYQHYDAGRSWYTSLGHSVDTFKNDAFRKHVLGGLQWAANKNAKPDLVKWSEGAPAPIASWESQGLGAEGKLFVFGGDKNTPEIPVKAIADSFAYDVESDTWSRLADMPEAISHAGQALDTRTIWIAGGFVGSEDDLKTTANVWKYDIASDTWSAGPDLPAPRGGGALVKLGRQLHFFGGTIRTGATYTQDYADHWVLNLDHPTKWEARAKYPNAANHMSGAALNGKLYGIGGQKKGAESGGNQAAVFVYDPTDDASGWTAVASMPRPLGHVAASTFVRGGRIVVVGGVTNVDPSYPYGGLDVADVIEYDPITNKWAALPSLPAPRQSTVADVVNGRIVAATGDNKQIPYDTTWLMGP